MREGNTITGESEGESAPGANDEAGDAEQLQAAPRDRSVRPNVSVHQINTLVQCMSGEFLYHGYFHQPVHQDVPACQYACFINTHLYIIINIALI